MIIVRQMADKNAHEAIHQALENVKQSQSPSLPIFEVLDQVCQGLMER